MPRALELHRDSRCDAVSRVDAAIARPGPRLLSLRYGVTGGIADIRLPPLGIPVRADELWRSTCFELFVAVPGGDAYYEVNLAPSARWAAYRFGAYRAGMTATHAARLAGVTSRSTPERYELAAELDLSRATELPADAPWRLAVSTVIEEADGRVSHWALAHPPGTADFHHAAGFVYELPAPAPEGS